MLKISKRLVEGKDGDFYSCILQRGTVKNYITANDGSRMSGAANTYVEFWKQFLDWSIMSLIPP